MMTGGRSLWAEGVRFSVQLSPEIESEEFDGRLFVLLSQRSGSDPMFGPDWFRPEPFYALNVHGMTPGDSIVIDESADGFPASLKELPDGEYRVQAVLDQSLDQAQPCRGEGNIYSNVFDIQIDSKEDQLVELVMDKVISPPPFPESEWLREVRLRSDLLSDFHHRDVTMLAAVVLPVGYDDDPHRHYPTIYIIPGFGGTHLGRSARYQSEPPPAEENKEAFIRVYLNPVCRWGHHVFANSATNGPWGDALVEELIPEIDRQFRTVAKPAARFLTGHSSGGWSSLWLQVTYPDFFGGTWSTSPDPVDFRDFQGVDLYADPPQSLYYDDAGNPRPLARRGSEPVLWFESFGRMDDCLQSGGQLRSFEAVFSPLDEAGLPQQLWHRESGQIDPVVAQAWRAYDIRIVLEENWASLSPRLAGKLHIITGELDTFYLEGAVQRLSETLRQLESDAEVEIVPGRNHSNILTAELVARMRHQMSEAYRRNNFGSESVESTASSTRSRRFRRRNRNLRRQQRHSH